MIVSRVLPTLIRFNHLINPITKIDTFGCSRPLVKLLDTVKFASINKRSMSSGNEDDLNNPKRHLDYQQLIEKRKRKVILIDVRQPGELAENGKIPDSINIPLPDVDKALGKMDSEEFKKTYGVAKPEKTDEIIFSCNSGRRSVKALKLALAHGYINSCNYKGGWQDWEKNTQST